MITRDEVKQISSRLSQENGGISEDNLNEEICRIVYRIDVFECDGFVKVVRHVDVEYSFGEYYEVCEDTSLFQFICTLCKLPLLQEKQEMVLYQK